MELLLQGPAAEGDTLDERLLEACTDAQAGVGVFAFASARGVEVLYGDPVFRNFARSHRYELLVGMSAVTDVRAVAALVQLEQELEGLEVQAFVTARHEPLFHPKMCWFCKDADASLFVGSGNLTLGGLRSNWEACLAAELSSPQAASLDAQWRTWKAQNSSWILPLDDQRVHEAAERNRRIRRLTDRARRIAEREFPGMQQRTRAASSLAGVGADAVFLTEVPRSGGRWKQVNFPRQYFEGYFGARAGRRHRVLFTHVDPDGLLHETEVRPSVSVASSNYRFELDAASGLDYPQGDRPIAVFLKLATRQFGYMLFMPGDELYPIAQMVLYRHSQVAAVRRAIISEGQLQAEWASCPLLLQRFPLMDVA